jgi:hypothetical protein
LSGVLWGWVDVKIQRIMEKKDEYYNKGHGWVKQAWFLNPYLARLFWWILYHKNGLYYHKNGLYWWRHLIVLSYILNLRQFVKGLDLLIWFLLLFEVAALY